MPKTLRKAYEKVAKKKKKEKWQEKADKFLQNLPSMDNTKLDRKLDEIISPYTKKAKDKFDEWGI